MSPLYIFDLDGTLALIEHRRHFVERDLFRAQQDWTAFYAACDQDVPNQPVIDTLNALVDCGMEVWVFSGRSDEVRHKTIQWLRKHTALLAGDLEGPALQMRRAGDFTPDDVLKRQWLDSMLPVDRKRLVAVFDDRDRVVKMWRDAGVTCFQVAPGAF